jgi:hypothetical protein
MKKCKSCQKEINAKAKKCPFCQSDQRNWFMKHKIITTILILIVLGMIGSMGKSGSSTSTSQSGNGSKQEGVKSIAKVGKTVQDGDIAYTVTDVTTATSLGNQYTQREAQGLFYVISLKIENKAKETKTIDSSMITLTDSQGRTFDRSIEGQTAKGMVQGKVDLFLQQVQPGLNVNGDIVFDIPKEATGLKLMVKGGYFGKGQQIDLGK